jgi:UDPglucose 6-dehydrogenase
LWHLGSVTAACVAEHFQTDAFDPNPSTVAALAAGAPPILEPGLADLVRAGLVSGKLRFVAGRAEAVSNADIVWIAYDTPVDQDDVADVEYVQREIEATFPFLKDGAVVLISSQMPAGSTARAEAALQAQFPGKKASFAYSPENLRLGKALDVFRNPDRIVAGVRDDRTRSILAGLFAPFSANIEWMRVESAEMTKHALNAFLATSVTFINEIAAICEQTGADAKEVERGLKSEIRIGPRAYLGPGGAFAGGTLARDIAFLTEIAREKDVPAALIPAVRTSNDQHKSWPRRKLVELLGPLRGKTIAILGLTYKAGTDTLRRSSAVELCQWIAEQGGQTVAFDPAVKVIPSDIPVRLASNAAEALAGADAAVVSTEWPEFRTLTADTFTNAMRKPLVVDANRFLAKELEAAAGITYVAVGKYKEKQ